LLIVLSNAFDMNPKGCLHEADKHEQVRRPWLGQVALMQSD
jgi:hypothetical protein